MNGRLGDNPDDVDAAFAQIVAGLEREGVGRTLPKDLDEPEPPRSAPAAPAAAPPTEAAWRGFQTEHDPDAEDEDSHYEPPEPPPLPKLRWPTVAAMVLIGLGVVVLVLPAVIPFSPVYATPVGLLSIVAGLVALLLRARTHPSLNPDDPDDNGAQV